MPIVTVAECKTFLQITASTWDALIALLIPIVEEKIEDYCNNRFIDNYKSINGILPTVYTYGANFEFINSDNSINNADKDFTAMNFKAGDIIRVHNSLQNERTFTISSIASTKIVVDAINSINNEDNDNTIVIARVKYPNSLKLTASQMVKWNLNKNVSFFKSEKIDDYSYTNDTLSSGYPKGIMDNLVDYSSIYLKEIPFNLLYYRQD